MLVARDPQTPDRCVLAQVRGSLAGPQPSLAYRITVADGQLPMVEWLGVSPIAADGLLAGAAHVQPSRHDHAPAFLEDFLSTGARTAREIWEAAQKDDLSARTSAAPSPPSTSAAAASTSTSGPSAIGCSPA